MNTNKTIRKTFLSWLPYLVFFAFSFVYFSSFGNYLFFYQEKSSLFIFSSEFLRENLHQPGGLLIWLGKLFSTFFYYPLAGAFIVSSVITLIAISISEILYLQAGKNTNVIPLLFGVVLFYLQTDYRFLLYNDLGLLLRVALFCLALKYISFIKGWGPVLLAPLLLYTTGGFTWVYLLLITFYFAFDKENRGWIRIIVLWFLSLISFYISKEFLFFQSGKTLLTFPFSDFNTGSQQILFLFAAGFLSILHLISGIRLRLPDRIKVSDPIANLITTILLVAILGIIGIKRFDDKAKKYFYVEKLFYQNKLNDVIAYNTLNPPTNSLTVFLNNIALCETDKLDDLLFHFPQSPDGKTLFLKWEMAEEVLKRGGYFYYTIGMINEAHRWAFENMVIKGHSPEGLIMLIKTELINGNYEVAVRYINILKKTIFYREEAKAFEKLLFNDTAVNADRELGAKRQNRIGNDFFSITDNPYINIEMILANDSLNRKAFEYRIAFMLLKKNYNGIANELPKVERFGFTRLPVHLEEAAVALSLTNKGIIPAMGNLEVSKNTIRRWNEYLTLLKQYGNNLKSAEPALKRQFGDTFWYYVFYK